MSPLKWIMVVAVGIPTVVLAVGYVAFRRTFRYGEEDVERQRKIARDLGLPLTWAELRPGGPVPDSQNAALDYKLLFPKLEANVAAAKALSRSNKPDAITARNLQRRRDELLGRLQAATRKPYYDSGRSYTEGFSTVFPEFASFKTAAKLLALRGKSQADAGNFEGAYSSLSAAQRLGAHVAQEPTLLAFLVGIATEAVAERQFAYVLQKSSRNLGALKLAKRTLDAFGPLPDLRYAMRGEFLFGLMTIGQTKSFGEFERVFQLSPWAPSPLTRLQVPDRVRTSFLYKHLKTYNDMVKLFPERSDWQAVRRVVLRAIEKVQADESFANCLNQILVPVTAQAADLPGKVQAERNLEQTSIRLFIWRLAKGAFPKTLPDFGPTSLDPFSGKPLRYRLGPSGAVLYSIGANRRDDGGKQVKMPGVSADIVRTLR